MIYKLVVKLPGTDRVYGYAEADFLRLIPKTRKGELAHSFFVPDEPIRDFQSSVAD